ncbi:F-box protein At1g47056-like [Macadamia integrifolia]|uniref:F-box protein At1g47056-like n=1 Tax=Macadamia integrifolia TaxID=60698 RepID=UPI001C500FCA|nr:F-box protein At1g47056-like [Macadamia integrifolia]
MKEEKVGTTIPPPSRRRCCLDLSLLLRSLWMGQTASIAGIPSASNLRDTNSTQILIKSRSTSSLIFPMPGVDTVDADAVADVDILSDGDGDGDGDYISDIPDECLAYIFQSLCSLDRKRCSIVCRRWLRVEGQSRHRLSLKAESDLLPIISSLFTRFDAVTKLALKCDRRSTSIGDEALVLISLRCRNLTRLKLRACRELTDAGMAAFAINCKGLKKLSCGSCTFGAKGMNAVLDHCSSLEELSVKRLRGLTDGSAAKPIGPGVAASSLKSICIKELYNGQCFGPLIIGSKNLRTLKLFRCSGDWDKLLEAIAERVTGLVEVHLERLQVSDVGLAAISNCLDLEILHLVKTPECTNTGLVSIADRCKLLRKLHIDGWKTNRIGDESLIAIGKQCPNLQELVLIGVNPTSLSLGQLSANCHNLERLALCGSDTFGDAEISCIAAKCISLKKLCIKGCPVTDHGMEALAAGCPNLIKVKVKKCRGVTCEGADWLRASRVSLAVNLDTGEVDIQDASASDGGAQDNGLDFPPVVSHISAVDMPSSSTGRPALFKGRLGLFAGRNFVASTFRRWSNNNSNSQSN